MVPVGFPKCARNFWCHLGVNLVSEKVVESGKKVTQMTHTLKEKTL
jgi:hypothetical protein